MAHISYNKLWETEFHCMVSKREKLQDININQLKPEVHDTYKKDEKITTNFKPTNHEDVINKAYLHEELKKVDGHISHIENDYNEFLSQNNKQPIGENLVRRAVKTTMQILFDKGLFDNYANADKISEEFSFTTRRRRDISEQVDDNKIQ